ncbi:MAG TPA: DNA mismatch repair endonuclease MutL [Thermoplasmata archaeon]|nr:DNA mismatch repair endonuclease MutL [Thermoplasmata archaeon]
MSADDGRRPIRRLRPTTVERIAAGEVVERPASVVKELVENAVDARATQVVVRLRDGGRGAIEVADDGEGIPAAELPLAVERHATSKLDPDGPIEGIRTLGFRGEALAAIGAVARLRLVSRTPDRDAADGLLVVGGEVQSRFAAPRSVGTTVEVADLFFATPARRKFLRAPAAEQLEVVRTLERQYLALPSVAVRLECDDEERLVLPATPNLTDAAAAVLGPEFRAQSTRLGGTVPGGRLFGAIGRPSVSAPTSARLFLAVNGRPIVARVLAQAVRAAYGDMLPRHRFPTGVVHLELAPDTIDVNVHPTKREIRFVREGELADALRRRVREALLETPLAAEVADRAPDRSGAAEPDEALADAPFSVARLPLAFAPQRTLDAPEAAPALRAPAVTGRGSARFVLLGVLDALYWVAATDDGFALVDQHAASERLLYEALRAHGALARQQLVAPVTVRLTPAQRAASDAHADAVRAAGFDVEPFGGDAAIVRAVPTYRSRAAPPSAVRDLLDELAVGGRPTLPDGLIERTTATIACHAAIRAGDPVEATEMARLVAALDALPQRVRTCPHGRPIFVQIPRARLDRWFLRRGP